MPPKVRLIRPSRFRLKEAPIRSLSPHCRRARSSRRNCWPDRRSKLPIVLLAAKLHDERRRRIIRRQAPGVTRQQSLVRARQAVLRQVGDGLEQRAARSSVQILARQRLLSCPTKTHPYIGEKVLRFAMHDGSPILACSGVIRHVAFLRAQRAPSIRSPGWHGCCLIRQCRANGRSLATP